MKILNNIELNEFIENSVEDSDINSVEGQKYDFHLSSWILKAKYKKPIDINKLSEESKGEAVIEPGETVFVMTQEYLNLPKDISVLLIPKRKIGYSGIILLGGMRADPGYHGQLFIGLYNSCSHDFVLVPQKKLIAGIFFKHEDKISFAPKTMPKDEFPEDLIKSIDNYNPINIQGLKNKIEELDAEITDIRKSMKDDITWRSDMKNLLEELGRDLKLEQENRIAQGSEFSKDITTLKTHIDTKEKTSSHNYMMIFGIFGILVGVAGIIFYIFSLK